MKDCIKSKTSTSVNNNKDNYNELSKRRFQARFKNMDKDMDKDNYIYKSTKINNSGQNEYIQYIDVKKTEYITNILKNIYL
jgi:hypothetical protein